MKLPLIAALSAILLMPQPARAEDFSKEQIQEIIHDYLLNNPDVMMKAMIAMRDHQVATEAKANASLVEAHRERIFNNPDSASVGEKDASFQIVEFYDYNCGACKIMFNALDSFMKDNKDIRIVFKEYPIFGANSEFPAKVALAIHRSEPTKYFEFHKSLMTYQGRVTQPVVESLLTKLGLDKEALLKEAEKPEITKILEDTKALASTLGATGTPLVVLKDEIINHALDLETLRAKAAATPTP